MTSIRRSSIRIGLALLLPVTGAVAADATVPVSVDSTGAALTVRVARPTPLQVVLEVLCEQAQASCKLPATLSDPVKPRTIRGSWPEVVAELLQSTGLSYGATPAAPGRPPYLMIEAPATVAAPSKPQSGPPAAALAQAPAVSPADAAQEPEPVAEETPATDEAPEPANVAPSASADASQPGALVTAATAAATPGAAFATTPFGDGTGNPLMSRMSAPPGAEGTPGMAVLPYSDEAGNPLTAPITNEPLALTPFAGPDGQPWPAPVVIPGQKLEYPIPPTDLAPPKPDNQ